VLLGMLGVLWRRMLPMRLLGLVRILLTLRVLLDTMLRLSSLLLVVEASHAGEGQRVRRRAGRALSVLVNGLAGRWVSILGRRRRRGMVIVSAGIINWLKRRRGMFLLFRGIPLLLRLARASHRRV
jgi:hypothetical protein